MSLRKGQRQRLCEVNRRHAAGGQRIDILLILLGVLLIIRRIHRANGQVFQKLVRAADKAGVITGKDIDKFEECGLRKTPSVSVACPTLADCPLALECKVTDVVSLGTHDMFVADIVAVTVDDSVIDEGGKLRIEKAGLMAYAHGTYFELGKKIGTFGFSVRKKKKVPRRK